MTVYRDGFVETSIEVELDEVHAMLRAGKDPERELLERLRDSGDRLCRENGAELRTDRAPEVHVSQAIRVEDDARMLLLAIRWPALVPEAIAGAARRVARGVDSR